MKPTKETVIELFRLAGYDFIGENPVDRLLLYDEVMEQNVQFWFSNQDNILNLAMDLIKNRVLDYGKSIRRIEVQEKIKNALGL